MHLPLNIFFTVLILGVPTYAQQPPSYNFPEGKEGLEQMIQYLLSASDKERALLSRSLRPSSEDYEVVFKEPFASRVFRYHKRLRRYVNIVVRPHYEVQTDYQIWKVTPESLKANTGDAKQFPGGYREIADYFQPGIVLYRFKFLFPGMRRGSGFDALVYVNGHWRLFPRPWMVSDELHKN